MCSGQLLAILAMFLEGVQKNFGGVGGRGRERGRTNKRPGTVYVTSGPMRTLEKKLHPIAQTDIQTDIQTHGYGDSMTELAQWGRFHENHIL